MSSRLTFQRIGRGFGARALVSAVVIALLEMLLPAATGTAIAAPTYSISGSFTAPSGAALAGIRVVACPPTGWPCFWTDSVAGGTYTISGLAAGSYQVSFGDPIHHIYATGYYDANSATGFAPDPADSTPVNVGPSVTGINVTLPVGYAIVGYVTTGDGTGLRGVGVGACSPTPPNPCFYATSGDGGWYSVSVDPGQYQVAFSAQGLPYASGFYVPGFVGNLAIDAQLEWGHDVHVGDTVNPDGASLLNVALPTLHTIAGRVTDTSANPLPGILVYACQQQVSPPVGDCGGAHQGYLSAVTDSSGEFSISAADGSSYVIEFSDPHGGYISGFYAAGANAPLGYAAILSGASLVTVNGLDAGPIDAQLSGNTPAGTNVVVPVDTSSGTPPVSLTFSNVATAGATAITVSTTPPAPPPSGFQLPGSSPITYDLATNATYTGNITVCFSYAGINPAPTQLLHYQNGAWQNITTSNDTTNQTICGTTTSLSPFALVAQNPIPNRYMTPVNTTLNVAASGVLALSGGTVISYTKAGHGSLTVSPNGSFTYLPKNGFTGPDTFTYRATGGSTTGSPVTVTIYVLGNGMNCTGCNLSGLSVNGLKLSGSNLSSANLTSASLVGVNLSGSNLSGVTGANANFDHINLAGANLSAAALSGATLASANLAGANASKAILVNANLSSANFTGANLASASLKGANTLGANFSGANVSGVVWK